jgi:hypothetical protein
MGFVPNIANGLESKNDKKNKSVIVLVSNHLKKGVDLASKILYINTCHTVNNI